MRSMVPSHKLSQEGPINPHQSATSAPPYPPFAAAVNNVDPSIEHEVSFGPGQSHPHNHNEDYESQAQQHLQHDSLQLGSSIQAELHLASRQRVHGIIPLPQHHQFDFRPGRVNTHTADPHSLSQEAQTLPSDRFDMLPPPESTHPTWQALHDYAQTHASAHGYALSINTTAKNRSRIKLACVCYGAPKNTHKLTPETRIRKNRVSYKTGCRMWVEGKKQEDGLWLLRVGESMHNHPGRSVEGWASQRKRTWGLQGGRVGVGGVTAKEERMNKDNRNDGDPSQEMEQAISTGESRSPSHSLESGGLVWRIVEQEMMRKGGAQQGRDRGVGRTVKVLEERLPGIHIFKRDVYNIRAQIKRARRAAGQEVGDGLSDNEEEGEDEIARASDPRHRSKEIHSEPRDGSGGGAVMPARAFPEIDPMLVAQCNDALRNVTQQEESEVDRLRREVLELRQALAQRTREVEERNSENESLRVQVELANVALYNERDGQPQ